MHALPEQLGLLGVAQPAELGVRLHDATAALRERRDLVGHESSEWTSH